MQKNPVAWGLDIGHSSIKAEKLSRVGETVTVLGYAIEPIVSGDATDREEAVVKALEQLATREEFGGLPVVASLSGRQIFYRSINIPVINPKKVDRMVELEARQQIPGKFDEVEWSYHLSPSPDGASNDVALFAARKDLIAELVTRSRRVGINLVGVSVSSLALYNFVRFDQDFPNDETVIILDVGAENTDLVLYQGDTLWMRTLAISGNDITKAFMKKFRVSFEEAETLKRQIGESRQADKIFKVIEGCLNELVSEVQRSLGFYHSQNANAKLESVVISGNTFRLPSLPQFLADRLRKAIISLEDLEKITVGAGIDREHFLQDLQSLGVAMGCALQGCGLAKATVNLLPNTLRVERLLKEKRWAAVAVLGIIAITWGTHFAIVQSVTSENADLIARIKTADSEQAAAQKESKVVLELVGPRAQELAAYATVGNRGLATAVFDEVTQSVQKLVADKGALNPANADITKADQDRYLQAAYLTEIEMPTLAYAETTGPFAAFAQPRMVNVEVHVPKANKDLKSKAIEDQLKAIATPAWLKEQHHSETLFTEVQTIGESPGSDTYYYIDDHHMDADGNVSSKTYEEKRTVPVTVLRFACHLGPKGGAK